MNDIRLPLLPSLLAVGLLATGGLAQPPVPPPTAPLSTARPPAARPGVAQPTATDPIFRLVDTDRNGSLSAAELANAAVVMRRLDTNADGQIDASELAASAPSTPNATGAPGHQRTLLVAQFDKDGDGTLDRDERQLARAYAKQLREGNSRRSRRSPRRGRGGSRGGQVAATPGEQVSPADVQNFPEAGLYDETVLRTFFLEFAEDDWEAELSDFYRTDVEVPATLRVDGRTYKNVGVRFRGNSSYFAVRAGQKRPFNLRLDHADKDQNLYGYRTLNLLNAHSDPSFLRSVLFNRIARDYIPAPQANFVKLVVNGESWGIYINEQQFNKDFTEEWFDSRDGVRWKVPTPSYWGSLTYNGDERANYVGFELKSKDSDEAYTALANVCKALNQSPIAELDKTLDGVLNVDRALWFLAIDNVLTDTDGYYSRGSDYLLYQEPRFGRFHLLPYDSNETFRVAWSWTWNPGQQPQPGAQPAGAAVGQAVAANGAWNTDGLDLSPFAGSANTYLPLVNRLLANPRLRARYVAHVRTLTNEWLDWEKLSPVVEGYRTLIDAEIQADTRKLASYEAFASSLEQDYGVGFRAVPGLKRFVQQRRAFLLQRPELAQPAPDIDSVAHFTLAPDAMEYSTAPISAVDSVVVRAKVASDVGVSDVLLYYATAANARFESKPMKIAADGLYEAVIPPQAARASVSYYVEARTADEYQTVSYRPARAEAGAASFHVEPVQSAVVINEVMAANVATIQDPQGDYDDWIELANRTDKPFDLSGMYLTDSADEPRKWQFPAGTIIEPHGLLLVWADQDDADEGLHASFKLSKKKEMLLLIDRDDRDNVCLDEVQWEQLHDDRSFARQADGVGEFEVGEPSPGQPNAP